MHLWVSIDVLNYLCPFKREVHNNHRQNDVFMHMVAISSALMLLRSHYLLLKYKDLPQISILDYVHLMKKLMQDPRLEDVVSYCIRSILSFVTLHLLASSLLRLSPGRDSCEAPMTVLLI